MIQDAFRLSRREVLQAGLVALPAGLLSPISLVTAADDKPPVRVVVWDEQQPAQKQAYEDFLGNQIAGSLKKQPGLDVSSRRLDDPEQGIADDVLDRCDVLIWWGHVRHREIKPETGQRIVERIKQGKLSLIALHSGRHWLTTPVHRSHE